MSQTPPNSPLQPGEVRIDLPLRTPAAATSKRLDQWGWIALFVVILAANLLHEYLPAPPISTVTVPAAPTPPGSYAVFAVRQAADDPTLPDTVHYVGFIREQIEIVPVPPNEVAEGDRRRARELGPSPDDRTVPRTQRDLFDIVPASLQIVHFGFQRFGRFTGVALARAELPPYILHGDVDVRCGDLRHDVHGFAGMMLQDGELSRASFNFADGSPRGPPAGVRKVYVMGKVNSVVLPDQRERSRLDDLTLDLGPRDTAEYLAELASYNRQIEALAARSRVPAEKLREYSGQKINVQDGKVIETFTANGDTVKVPDEAGAGHEPGGELRGEHAVEPHPAPHFVP